MKLESDDTSVEDALAPLKWSAMQHFEYTLEIINSGRDRQDMHYK